MRIIRILAGSTVRAKQVSIRVLLLWVVIALAAVAIIGFDIFAILARVTKSIVPSHLTITSKVCLAVFIQGLETLGTVETMSFTALNSRNVAVITEPTVGTCLSHVVVQHDVGSKIKNEIYNEKSKRNQFYQSHKEKRQVYIICIILIDGKD